MAPSLDKPLTHADKIIRLRRFLEEYNKQSDIETRASIQRALIEEQIVRLFEQGEPKATA